ncbi:MAG: hypothetical protein EOO46_19755 [Flavobacterium sp.]|nr:MAG: hypothetical protein EOO46_19755 [Flavobacterium sp.]
MENLEKHITYLKSITRDLSDHLARNGRNKSIRDTETSKLSHAADLLERYLNNNKELSDLLWEHHGGNDYAYQETLTWQYVARDTARFIEFLKEKIATAESKHEKEAGENSNDE